MRCVILVGCSAEKLSAPAPARELYTSQLFRRSLTYAELVAPGDVWIISAHYGLVGLSDVLTPYNVILSSRSKHERVLWGVGVVDKLTAAHPGELLALTILAGQVYSTPIAAAAERVRWPAPSEPMRGMGVGHRKQWLGLQIRQLRELVSPTTPRQPNITIPKSTPPTYIPTRPYVTQHQAPLGWVVEVIDPTLADDRQVVKTVRPPFKMNRAGKEQLINSYLRRKEHGDRHTDTDDD